AAELHRGTLDRAVAKTIDVASRQGVPLTEAAVVAIRRTLSALPDGNPAGRLHREPPPVGFELLAGVPIKARVPEESAPTLPVRARKRELHAVCHDQKKQDALKKAQM